MDIKQYHKHGFLEKVIYVWTKGNKVFVLGRIGDEVFESNGVIEPDSNFEFNLKSLVRTIATSMYMAEKFDSDPKKMRRAYDSGDSVPLENAENIYQILMSKYAIK